MPPHRGRPAPRHRAPGGAARHRIARPRARHIGPAVRRLMITPTFAAGLGVVVAAGLTFDMPRAVLHFGVPDGTPCAVTGCGATPVPGRGGVLASAKPGVHLAAPATHGSAASGGGPAAHSPSSGHAGHDQVRVAYAKTQQWPWGFADQITISGLAEGQGSWRLAFGYPGTSILEVSGAQWQPNGPD